jgi:short-subunit dehydrogenase
LGLCWFSDSSKPSREVQIRTVYEEAPFVKTAQWAILGLLMKKQDFRGTWIVVTGASSGLGREIALALAVREGAHVVLAARRRDKLEQLAEEIRSLSEVQVQVVPVDLADPMGADTLFAAATSGRKVHALVNCAGTTYFGRTLDASMEKIQQILAVNFLVEMRLTLLFLRYFLDQGRGAILAVTSIGAFLPLPFQNVYAATKQGMQAFMEGLAQEYRGTGITFCTFAPGGINTDMIRDTRFGGAVMNMDPARAAAHAVDGFKTGRIRHVPGLMARTLLFLVRHLPRSLVVRAAGRIFRP